MLSHENLTLLLMQYALPRTDEEDSLLAASAANNPDAFGELYSRYVDSVYRYHLARTGSDPDAQDLTSQTFLAALESLARFSGRGTFRAWLFGIAHNKLHDHYRRGRHETDAEIPEDASEDIPYPEQVVSDILQHEQLVRALQAIAPERAEAITLRFFGGLRTPEVARVMGKSQASVKMLVHRGLNDLQVRLSPLLEYAQ
jgi:RNA polymerase sigma-70 factor (ECF subfamily)